MTAGKFVIISGPSAGAGKDTVLNMFLAKHDDWHLPPSVTTRKPRQGEVHGRDMIFVDEPTFRVWQEQDKFLETDHHALAWYGTLREPVEQLLNKGKNIILRIDVNGALVIKESIPKAILIFVTAENWEALEKRIRGRATEDEKAINHRLKLAQQELKFKDKYDFIVINPSGHPEKAVEELENILIN